MIENYRSGFLWRLIRCPYIVSGPILHAPLAAPKMGENSDDLDLCEYLVRVEWIKAVPRSEAYWEKGFFALQHTACRLLSSFTIERLSQHFGLDD